MTASIIWDISLAVIILLVVFMGFGRGFLSSLISLVGTAASCIVAALLSPKAANWIYDNYLAQTVEGSISESLSAKLDTFANLLNQMGLADTVTDAANGTVRTLAVSLITVVVFLVIFLLAMLIVRLLIHAMRGVNRVPVLGGINRILGGVLGAGEAFLLCYVIGQLATVLVSFSKDQWSWVNTGVVEGTKLLSWFIQYKFPF